ncbi:hypothetical protein HOY80DRAFT_111639 [Tuber brumale]|nr:hypothetical protein HOY80DRAFT_111639 [Tuber brumale]
MGYIVLSPLSFPLPTGCLCDSHGYYGQDIQAHFRSTSRLSAFVHLFHHAIIPPTPLQPVLIVCIKGAVCWIWSKIHRCGFVLHLSFGSAFLLGWWHFSS